MRRLRRSLPLALAMPLLLFSVVGLRRSALTLHVLDELIVPPCDYGNGSMNRKGSTGTSTQHPSQLSSESDHGLSPDLFVAVYSAASGSAYAARRAAHRRACASHYAAAGAPYKFVVGLPFVDPFRDPSAKNQGMHWTDAEAELSEELLAEVERHGDVEVAPFRDVYRDLSNKLLHVFRYGLLLQGVGVGDDREEMTMDADVDVEMAATGEGRCQHRHRRFRYIAKIDDEYCLNITAVRAAIQRHEASHPHSELYLGNHLWKGDEFDIMKGRDGTVAKYMSGWVIVLSRRLAKAVAVEDGPRSALSATYGNLQDDSNLGKWVKHAIEKRNGRMAVEYVVDHSLFWDIEKKELKRKNETFASQIKVVGPHNHKAMYTSAQCTDEAKYLGTQLTPEDCARTALQQKSTCGDTFMFSEIYPSWGCRCCVSGDVTNLSGNPSWSLYSISDFNQTVNHPSFLAATQTLL